MVENHNKIMDRLHEHLNVVLKSGREWVGIFLQGSQNYHLDYEGSDIDSKVIVLPTFSDFVLNARPVSTTHIMENDEHVDLKDIREMFNCIRKQNVNFVEILFTPYRIINPKYADLFQPVLDAREEIARYNNYAGINCLVGMALEKQHAMEHPYPAVVEKIKRFGYDPKQLHHALRMREFMMRYIRGAPYADCLISQQQDRLKDVKRGCYSLEEARELMQSTVDSMIADKAHYMETTPVAVNEHANEVLQTATVEIMKRCFLFETHGDVWPQRFYMMVGLPGSGKSTTAEFMSNVIVHSSDAIREELLGDENDQSNQNLVFETLQKRVKNDLMAGFDVVYDATNLSYKRRMAFLHELDALHLPQLQKICLFHVTPFEECLKRNASRPRTIPEDVIRRMYHQIDVPQRYEGWDDINFVNDVTCRQEIDPLIERLSGLSHDNPHHQLSIGEHMRVAHRYLMNQYSREADLTLNRAVLLHDIGKEETKVFLNAKGEPSEYAHFYNHERVGAYDSFLYTRDLNGYLRLDVALLIRWHMLPFMVERSDNPSKTEKKFKALLGEYNWRRIQILNDCDRHAHHKTDRKE